MTGRRRPKFLSVRRGGLYYRVANPRWKNPLDGRHSAAKGGRWNPPGSFPVVYLNSTLGLARTQVLQRLQGQPYGPEDLNPREGPVLVVAQVPSDDFTDCVTRRGYVAAGLPAGYPMDEGRPVGWGRCQPIGLAAWSAGSPGIAARSATGYEMPGEELAWFQRDTMLPVDRKLGFDAWFWPVADEE